MIWETLHLSLQAIFRNALRSVLTVLGVVIGVAAVIAMVTLGQGSTAQVTAQVESLGTNLLMVRPGAQGMGPGRDASAEPFSMDDVSAIENELATVSVAAPYASQSTTVIAGNETITATVTGTTNGYLEATDWPVVLGREFDDGEISAGSAVCILGETVRSDLFGTSNPVGERIRLDKLACDVIGVLDEKGAGSFGQDQDNVVLIPIRTMQRRVLGTTDVSMIYASVDEAFPTDQAVEDIQILMRERRRISSGEEDDFNVMDMAQIAEALSSVTGTLTGLLSAVAGVSLLVGGIGIMNIMLVSVTERTREIGIRLAIGAQAGQVLMQFLVEAVVLSLMGGAVGIILGLLIGYFGSNMLGIPFVPNIPVSLGAFAFSAVVGVIFGYFPARSAARLDPIEALRHQ